MKVWIFILGPKKACDPHLICMNHEDSRHRTTLVHVLVAIVSRAQTRDTSSVLGWGALTFKAEHAGSIEVNEARRPYTYLQQAVCVRRKKIRIKNTKKSAENTPRKPQQPGNHDRLETACDETRPTR